MATLKLKLEVMDQIYTECHAKDKDFKKLACRNKFNAVYSQELTSRVDWTDE